MCLKRVPHNGHLYWAKIGAVENICRKKHCSSKKLLQWLFWWICLNYWVVVVNFPERRVRVELSIWPGSSKYGSIIFLFHPCPSWYAGPHLVHPKEPRPVSTKFLL